MSVFTDMQRELFASSNDFLMRVSKGELAFLFPEANKKSNIEDIRPKKENIHNSKWIDNEVENFLFNDPEEDLNELRKCTFEEDNEIKLETNDLSEKESEMCVGKVLNFIRGTICNAIFNIK